MHINAEKKTSKDMLLKVAFYIFNACSTILWIANHIMTNGASGSNVICSNSNESLQFQSLCSRKLELISEIMDCIVQLTIPIQQWIGYIHLSNYRKEIGS